MHPLVRSLYKEALYVGRDYPLGLSRVREEWKNAIRNPKNCPSCYNFIRLPVSDSDERGRDAAHSRYTTMALPKKLHSKDYPNLDCERELRKAVGKGRYMIREMIGVIQLKKYRSLKQRYSDNSDIDATLRKSFAKLQDSDDTTDVQSKEDGK